MKIIAYGSLMNRKSLEKTLGREVNLRKTKICGYARIFNAPFGRFAFLNLTRLRRSKTEVGYFEILPIELRFFADREAGSNLIEVKKNYFAFVWPKSKCIKLPVLASYIRVCEQGAENLGVDFWQNTTRPQKVTDDLQNPLYK
jgi:hypothetical protein